MRTTLDPKPAPVYLIGKIYLLTYRRRDQIDLNLHKFAAQSTEGFRHMSSSSTQRNAPPTGPFESLRDYVAALEAHGKLLRIKRMDQDAYEATGFAYRLFDRLGDTQSPAFAIEEVKLDGRWMKGPVFANLFPGSWAEAIVLGLEEISDNERTNHDRAIEHLMKFSNDAGQWKKIKPAVVNAAEAPVKEVIVKKDLNILDYPWFKNNPADGGRYINTGIVVLEDPTLGRNVGIYRCQVKGPLKIGMNINPGQDGGRFIQALRSRGEKVAKVAIAMGVEPILWSLAATKLTAFGEDDYEVAGGIAGRPLRLVKCETNDILVPALAEMIIEGEIPLNEFEEEGPYAELLGFLGEKKQKNLFMNITAVTHRKNPWFVNSFTGVIGGILNAAITVNYYLSFRNLIPNLVAIHSYERTPKVVIVSIDKKVPGEGMQAGQYVAASSVPRVVIVVDKDVDILNPLAVFHAVGARWQPTASVVIPQTRNTIFDPSLVTRGLSSKIIIDATQQLPQEGGPASAPPLSRSLLEEALPGLMAEIDAKWQVYWELWKKE